MQTGSSGYLMVFRETALERYEAMSADERRECMRQWNDWTDGLAAEGKLRSGNTLADEVRVVAAPRGRPQVVDGPFAETKELIAGYFLLAADSMDEATDIARRCPLLVHGMTVEVRPVAAACHLARSLGWETMREPVDA